MKSSWVRFEPLTFRFKSAPRITVLLIITIKKWWSWVTNPKPGTELNKIIYIKKNTNEFWC